MSKIYIIMGSHDYESSHSLVAFRTKAKADAFMLKLDAWKRARPKSPEYNQETTFQEPEWDAFNAAESKWRSEGPGGGAEYDSYYVHEVELRP